MIDIAQKWLDYLISTNGMWIRDEKRNKNNRSEVLGYQPNNPLTLYYKKYIEKQND